MNQINLTTVKDFALKYWVYLALIITIVLLFSKCNDNSQLSLAIKTQKKVTKEYVANAKVFVSKADSLEKVQLKLKKNIALLQKDSIKSNVEIAQLKNKVNAQLAVISHYNSSDIAKYFQTRYNDKKGVVITQYGVALSNTIAKQNISEQAVCDGTKEEIIIIKTDLQKEKAITREQDKLIVLSDEEKAQLRYAISEGNKALESSETTAKTAEKGIRKERNMKNMWKVITGAVLTGTGYLLFFR